MKQDLIRLIDQEPSFLRRVLDLAKEVKTRRRDPSFGKPLEGKAVATIYEKPSTRTKVSFEVGIRELGAQVVELTRQGSQLSRGESIADTARTLDRYVDGIVFRAFSHDSVVGLARWSRVPVINALTDLYHPCQILADLQTVEERFGGLDVPITFIGNGSNIAHSLLGAAARLGLDLTLATPASAKPDAAIYDEAVALRDGAGKGSIRWTDDPKDAVARAKVIYTDVWFDMGKDDPETVAERSREFAGFQVNTALLADAPADAVVLHCLPAQRGREVTDEVLDGPRSAVFDEAENRLHAQKAVLTLLLGS